MRSMSPAADSTFDPTSVVRGLVIGLIALGMGFLPKPADDGGLSPAVMLAVGIALQGLIVVARWSARRYERAHGLDDSLVPVVVQVGTLLADGVTVLLCVIAVWHGMHAPLSDL